MTTRRRSPASTSPSGLGLTGAHLGIRVPAHLGNQLKAIAKRENNGVAAVVRRLLSQALATTNDSEAA